MTPTWADCVRYLKLYCNEGRTGNLPPATYLYAMSLWLFSETAAAANILEIGIGPESVSGCTFLHSLARRKGGRLTSIDIERSRPLTQYKELANTLQVAWDQVYGNSLAVDIPVGPYDLVYIDGDHDYAHALGDLQRFGKEARPGGYILVDDFESKNDVGKACDQFQAETGWQYIVVPYHPPFGNGRALFQRKA